MRYGDGDSHDRQSSFGNVRSEVRGERQGTLLQRDDTPGSDQFDS